MVLNTMINQVVNEIRLIDRFRFDPDFEVLSPEKIKSIEKQLSYDFESLKVFRYKGCQDIDSAVYYFIQSFEPEDNRKAPVKILKFVQFKYRNDHYDMVFSNNTSISEFEFDYLAGMIELSKKAFDRGGTVPVVIYSMDSDTCNIATYDLVMQKTQFLTVDKRALETCADTASLVLIVDKNQTLNDSFKADLEFLKADKNCKSIIWRNFYVDNLAP